MSHRLPLFLLFCLNSTILLTQNSSFGSKRPVTFYLSGDVYLLPPGTARLPDFSALEPVGRIYANRLDIPPTDFTEGFPGVTDRFEWFGINYRGRFYIHIPGEYVFKLGSDDGSRLYIDSMLVVDNDGYHPYRVREGKIFLQQGIHHINIQYFQGPRTQIALQLMVAELATGRFLPFDVSEFQPAKIRQEEKGSTITLENGLLFDYDEALLQPEAEKLLTEIYRFYLLSKNYQKILVIGNTDNIGGEDYNQRLSERRAEAVQRFLVDLGVPMEKIKTKGLGATQPIAPNDTEINRARNRRVEVVIVE